MKLRLVKKSFSIILTTIFLLGLNVIPANASTTVACSGGGEFHIVGTTVVEKPGPGGTICAGEAIIPNTILTIDEYAFYDTAITSVIIPNSVTTIVSDAFSSTPLLNSISIPNSVTTIGNFAFYQSGLTSVTIGNQVATIGILAFFDNTGLTTVNFSGNAPASVADDAFDNTAVGAKAYVFIGKTGFPANGTIWKGLEIVYRSEGGGGGGGGGGDEEGIVNSWVGKQSISCSTPNPWVKEKLGFASNAKPVLVSAENTIGKTITQSSYDSLKSSGVVFDTVSKKVSTATETLPLYGCKDKLLSGKINQPIQFIAGGYTLQSDAHGYINTSDLKWHDTNGVTLYTNTAAFMHTIKFTKTGKYVVVLTEQPDTSRGLIPTYGVRSIRFEININ